MARQFDWEKARNIIEIQKLHGLTRALAGLEGVHSSWGAIWENGVYVNPEIETFGDAFTAPTIVLYYLGNGGRKSWVCAKRVLEEDMTMCCPDWWLGNNARSNRPDIVYDGMLIKYHPVIKIEDAQKFLTNEQMEQFESIVEVIREGRISEGKSVNHVHLIVNTDEPYAPKIIEILKANNHWG